MAIDALIDKTDSFELIRDAIATILAAESVAQQALAVSGSKDSTLWKLRVYVERSNPWEAWIDSAADKSPIVNVWFESTQFDKSGSNRFERQRGEGTFNIDCYGYGQSAAVTGGHTPGDMTAAKEAHRAARLVRNILMSDQYLQLGMRGTVTEKWIQSITAFQPQQQAEAIQHIVGCRIALQVSFNEWTPQNTPQSLEYIAVEITEAPDGEIVLAAADYDFRPEAPAEPEEPEEPEEPDQEE